MVFSDGVTVDESSSVQYRWVITLNMLWKQPKQRDEMLLNGSVTRAIWACFSFIEDETEGSKTHKHAATKSGCSKAQEKYLNGWNSAFGDVAGLQTQGSGSFASKYKKKKKYNYFNLFK